MYSAMQIAHYIIDLCNRVGRPVSNLEIQKILYFLQVYYMRVHDGAALFTDDIYAWTYGPVVPEVYYTYNGYGGSIIRNSYDVSDIAENDSRDLRDVILRLEQKGPWNLVDMSHAKGGPWDTVYRNGLGDRKVIGKELLTLDQNVI